MFKVGSTRTQGDRQYNHYHTANRHPVEFYDFHTVKVKNIRGIVKSNVKCKKIYAQTAVKTE